MLLISNFTKNKTFPRVLVMYFSGDIQQHGLPVERALIQYGFGYILPLCLLWSLKNNAPTSDMLPLQDNQSANPVGQYPSLFLCYQKLCRQIVGFTTKSTFSTLVCIGWRKIIHQDANIPNGFSMTLHSLDKQYLKIICFSVNLCPGIGIITMVAVKIPHHLPWKSFEESFNNKNCLKQKNFNYLKSKYFCKQSCKIKFGKNLSFHD